MRTKQQMPMYYSFVEDLLNNRVSYKIENAIKKANQPHLIIHGDKDLTVQVEEAKELGEWNENADLKIITGTNHTFDISHPHKEEQLSEAAKKVLTYSLAFVNKKIFI